MLLDAGRDVFNKLLQMADAGVGAVQRLDRDEFPSHSAAAAAACRELPPAALALRVNTIQLSLRHISVLFFNNT